MGRCLAFNFGPEELKQKLKNVRYFVYTPDYDSAGYSSDQHFYAVLDITTVGAEGIKEALNRIQLQGSSLRFSEGKDGKLFVALASLEPKAAITERQLADVLLVDEELHRLKLIPSIFVRNQDVVFGEQHFHAKELSKPFQHVGALSVPLQAHWSVGRNHQEALSNYEASQKK